MTGAAYELEHHPRIGTIALARNLGRLRAGGHMLARESVVAAIRLHDCGPLADVLFDLTSEYGSDRLRPLLGGMYVSLTRAVGIGFPRANLGHWLRLLQPRAHELQAHGQRRSLNGIQTLVGINLLSLSVVSYLGAPFDR